MIALELNPTVSRYIYTVPTAIALPNLDSVVKAEKNNAGLFSPLLNSSASTISAINALVKVKGAPYPTPKRIVRIITVQKASLISIKMDMNLLPIYSNL